MPHLNNLSNGINVSVFPARHFRIRSGSNSQEYPPARRRVRDAAAGDMSLETVRTVVESSIRLVKAEIDPKADALAQGTADPFANVATAELPSLSCLAETPEAALRGIKDVVEDVVVNMVGTGESPPQPFADRNYSGKITVRIPPAVHWSLAIGDV